ncbi:uncharacterized protein LOC106641268 [Copidosoma floridanum]|uniref:uncharacterized protein LOC106641268 n=1 Tax=Copidosoma floridanum TaxID=29053 RepID=UPI0006C94B9B|nr:uncharacterized protein LOC106641268 [Copidosoma floridanum]
MSAFKRHQSKVFWGQMESRDLLASQGDFKLPASPRPRPRPFPASRESEEAFSLSNDENQADSDTTDPENTTVIHVEIARRDSLARSSERASEMSTPSTAVQAGVASSHVLEERSFSPSSRGQRSQDSGFSDSDDSSDLSPESPRRRRRRSSRRRHELQRSRSVGSGGVGPAHTSTPKRPGSARRREETRQLDYCTINESPEAEERPAVESLGDFLYSSDPPNYEPCQPGPPESSRACTNAHAPVKDWLCELRLDVEEECVATLQSKSLPRRRLPDDPRSRDLRLLTASATTAAKKAIDTAGRFDRTYRRLIDAIGNSKNEAVDQALLSSIEAEALEILAKFGRSLPRRIVQASVADPQSLVMQLTRLKHSVDRALDDRLDFYIEKVVRGLEEAPREGGSTARGSLAALTALGLAGPRAGASVARCSGIRALLASLVSSSRLSSELRCASLRALASVCCCLEAVDQFVAQGGPDILADILGAEATPHTEKSEAAALLVQVTAPWMDRVALPYLEPHGHRFVRALTELAERTTCKQTLLIAAAGLNYLAHSRKCVAAVVACDSIKKLLRCIKKSNDGNVWLMEQVASLVGQVARLPQARAHLVETRASVALVCFLRMQPPGLEDEYRRLAATTRETLTRLCVDPEIAGQVVAVGGSDCLPELAVDPAVSRAIKDEGARFHSTKSLRVARRIAAEQIGIARINDCSPR